MSVLLFWCLLVAVIFAWLKADEARLFRESFKFWRNKALELSKELDKLKEALNQDYHYVTFDDEGWSMEHLVECRPNMTSCFHHKTIQNMDPDEYPDPGRYVAYYNGFTLNFVEQED